MKFRAQPRDHWWTLPDSDIPSAVFSALQYLDEQQAQRRTVNLHHMRLYSNRAAMSMSGRDFMQSAGDTERIKMNVVKSCIDAAVAQIGSNRPRPLFKTVKGDFSQRQRAERLGKFVMGQFYALKQYMLSQDIFRDACVFGTGIQKTWQEGGRICIERVFPDELFVDDNDGRMRDPRSFYQHKEVSREVLATPEDQGGFGLTEDEAEAAALIRDINMNIGLVNPASVVEAWHMPSGYGAKDGRHVICTDSKLLYDAPWNLPHPNLAFFRWNIAPVGFWGIGVAEELAPMQIELNYLAQKIQRLMTLATSVVFTKKGEHIRPLSNKDWSQYEYTNTPPEFRNVTPIANEYFQHMDRIYQRCFELVGISQLQAQSLKPAGLDSGEALRVYNDIGTRRFQHTSQMWEQYHLDVSELLLDCAREAQEDGEEMKVLAAGDRDVEEIDFNEAAIEKSKYVMQVWPTNILPDTPAGKVAMVKNLAQALPELQPHIAGLLTGVPDLEKVVSLITAPLDIAEMMVDSILTTGEYEPPHGAMNLQLARDVATRSLLRAKIDGVEEERIALVAQYISDIDKLLAPPPAPVDPMAGQPPMGAPGMPPGMPMDPMQMQMLPPDSMPPVQMQPPPGPMGPMG